MHRLTKIWFSPWIPLVFSTIGFGFVLQNDLALKAEYEKDVLLAFMFGLIAIFALAVVLLLARFAIKWKRDGFSADLFFSTDFLAFYLLLSWLYFDSAADVLGGEYDLFIALLFAGLVFATVYRFFPGPFDWLHSLIGIIAPGATVYRPDVLGQRHNIKSVQSFLPQQENGIFCGEIRKRRTGESLYVSAEDRGVVIGPPGTGKTAFMVTQLLDLAERKGSFVCLDIKPELHGIMREKLLAQGYRIRVFNPTNKADRYNLLDDLSGPTAIGELAYSLVPSANGDNRAFDEGARDLLDGIISYLRFENKPVSLPALREFLAKFSSETELIATLSQCADPDVKDTAFAIARSAKNARFMGSVFATLRSNLRFLRLGDIRDSIEHSDFSLSLFREDQPVALFLQFEERHQETTQLLLSAMVSHLFNYFIEHIDRKPVLLMLDEIGNVPRIPGLVEKLNTIRSRKLPTWMYWQGIQQMQKYGKQANEGPNSIMAACDFHMAFRLNDNDSAHWFSERIGTVDRTTRSQNDRSANYQTIEEPIMKVADLQALPFGESVAIYRGKVWRNWATPYFERWPDMARAEPVKIKKPAPA